MTPTDHGIEETEGEKHTRLMEAIRDELINQHSCAFLEDTDCVLVIPSGATSQSAYVKIDTSALAEAVLSAAPAPPSLPAGAADPVAWRPIESAPCGVDFLAIGPMGDIRRCWRHKPSSRTDEILAFTNNRKFTATHWMPLLPPPAEISATSPSAASAGNPATDHVDLSPTTAGSAEGVKLDREQVARADPSPWHPEADPQRLKVLGKLAEEAAELGAALARCIIQGIDEREPVTGKLNREWLEEEIADVLANIHVSTEHLGLDKTRMATRVERKSAYIQRWLDGLTRPAGGSAFPTPTQTGEGQ